jgi:hypothetical protein
MKLFIPLILSISTFAAEPYLLKNQMTLEAKAIHHGNLERISVDPKDCKVPDDQDRRIEVMKINIRTLQNGGALLHCPDLKDKGVFVDSDILWKEARVSAQQAGLVPVEPSSIYVAQAESSSGQQMVSLEELADRREKEEQEEKRSLFGSGTLQKVIDKPTAKPSATESASKETKSCEVIHFTGRKGAAVVKRYLDQAACQELCLERKHPEKITHCFFDRSVIWKSNQ